MDHILLTTSSKIMMRADEAVSCSNKGKLVNNCCVRGKTGNILIKFT